MARVYKVLCIETSAYPVPQIISVSADSFIWAVPYIFTKIKENAPVLFLEKGQSSQLILFLENFTFFNCLVTEERGSGSVFGSPLNADDFGLDPDTHRMNAEP
jgi:hypothetical protein